MSVATCCPGPSQWQCSSPSLAKRTGRLTGLPRTFQQTLPKNVAWFITTLLWIPGSRLSEKSGVSSILAAFITQNYAFCQGETSRKHTHESPRAPGQKTHSANEKEPSQIHSFQEASAEFACNAQNDFWSSCGQAWLEKRGPWAWGLQMTDSVWTFFIEIFESKHCRQCIK